MHPREVFRNAIINKANAVIICHNHPSGDLTPSTEDINITRRLKETGKLLGIQVLDHLIINGINQHEVFSFKSKGVLETAGTYDITTSQSIGDTNSNFAGTAKEQGSDFIVPIQEHSYPLPDPNVSISDRNSYGYLDDEMLPLSRERATELFEQDLTVYLLYEDDTGEMVFDSDDIESHSGIFAIERNDWIALQDYEAMKEAESVVSSYNVDAISLKEQPNFILEQNYLETAEKSVEQNYNQLDGIINNKPTVAELEQTVQAGGTISLLDLANATKSERQEKKTSVVEQLKAKPPKEKEKKAPQIGSEMER